MSKTKCKLVSVGRSYEKESPRRNGMCQNCELLLSTISFYSMRQKVIRTLGALNSISKMYEFSNKMHV